MDSKQHQPASLAGPAISPPMGAFTAFDQVVSPPFGHGRNIALIRGAMLELVRRDGRDLTARQLTTLLSVYLDTEIHSVSTVARMLRISRPGVTRILDRLVEAGLVTRAEDPTDRRRVLIYQTRAGTDFVQDLISVADRVAQAIGALS